jgi:hypothetical protein
VTFVLRDVPAVNIQRETFEIPAHAALGMVRQHKMRISQRVGYGHITQN